MATFPRKLAEWSFVGFLFAQASFFCKFELSAHSFQILKKNYNRQHADSTFEANENIKEGFLERTCCLEAPRFFGAIIFKMLKIFTSTV